MLFKMCFFLSLFREFIPLDLFIFTSPKYKGSIFLFLSFYSTSKKEMWKQLVLESKKNCCSFPTFLISSGFIYFKIVLHFSIFKNPYIEKQLTHNIYIYFKNLLYKKQLKFAFKRQVKSPTVEDVLSELILLKRRRGNRWKITYLIYIKVLSPESPEGYKVSSYLQGAFFENL